MAGRCQRQQRQQKFALLAILFCRILIIVYAFQYLVLHTLSVWFIFFSLWLLKYSMINIFRPCKSPGRAYTTCASCRKDNPLVHDPAWHPKTTLDTLVQSSLIKACAFFCYWQVHLQTTIHQTSTPSLQASNKLSKSDLWWQSFTETEWSVSIACIFYPSPFISLWMNSAP